MPLSLYPFSVSTTQPTMQTKELQPSLSHHPLYGSYLSEPQPEPSQQAQKAHELLAGIRRRHVQLARFLQSFNVHKANPLGGAMCAELEDKIHQMALLIRTQQQQLKSIVCLYDDEQSSGSDDEWQQEEFKDSPVTNWMATIRMAVLKQVVDFSTFELPRIERSPLLLRYPPAQNSKPSLF
ncbi:hypothetical protein IWW36_001704 [Coemansia brasiliensis]|uniref:Uncharacterized protein n=1 Tax=Coemansia brasiliensis TaxID=2650707 RepID=A0A9W8IG68_9FUNG|nr:hypothetical protein IWW36_001704 [Coemansia brasiliensis]